MARQPRFAIPGLPQHIIQRGNNRQTIFRCRHDYRLYVKWLGEAAIRHRLNIHAYVLMTNHIHLLATPDVAGSIGKVMQSLGRRYVGYFNSRHERTGTLWEGRYRATLIDSERYFLVCAAYIELNPVRAGLVRLPEQYEWSSYRHNGLGQSDELVTGHEVFERLGRSREEQWATYRALCRQGPTEEAVVAIREATNRAWVLGDSEFCGEIERSTGRRAQPLTRGRPLGSKRTGQRATSESDTS